MTESAIQRKASLPRVLIVDDEISICNSLALAIRQEDFEPVIVQDGQSALKLLRTEHFIAILLDVKLPDMNGMDVLKRVTEMRNGTSVILMTGYGNIHSAVEAMCLGAYDYLEKPFHPREVIWILRRAAEQNELRQKVRHLSSELKQDAPLHDQMGPSEAVDIISTNVNRVAKWEFSVIIQGETGTGKELVARAIHQASNRSQKPFVPVDCGAIPDTLFESELFGHERGAFTSADVRRIGKFEEAEGGTLFFDEVSNMPPDCQAKLMRVLQEKVVYRVGSSKPVNIDVRILAASNQNLKAAVTDGKFRQDLFFRLNDFMINIPPLRDRKEDIVYLAKRFLSLTNAELRKNVGGFSKEAMSALLVYSWPGNVRQLRSTIRRATLLADDDITEDFLDISLLSELSFPINNQQLLWDKRPLKEIVHEHIIILERHILCEVIHFTGGNKAEAARLLKIDYKTIHTKMKEYSITIDEGDNNNGKQMQQGRGIP